MTKMLSKNIQRYSGILGVIVIWSFLITGMLRTGLGLVDSRPISYLGVDPRSSLLFSSGLLISSALFLIFAFFAKTHYKASNKFLRYFIIGQIGQIIAAIAPYGKDSPFKLVHTIAAFVLAFSLPFLIREFARSQRGKDNYDIFQRLVRIEILGFIVGIGLFIFTTGIAPIGEALPAIGFHLWIIVVTFQGKTESN